MSLDRKSVALAVGLLVLVGGGAYLFASSAGASGPELPTVTVYKSSSCGCCSAWVEHMEDAGFEVDVVDDPDLRAVKAEHRVPSSLHACHTATVGGYTVEGHVPAADVRRLLEERPPVAGIGVGGMPKGSPGMPGVPEPYHVMAFTADGGTAVWARH